jgi:hypothetical protein
MFRTDPFRAGARIERSPHSAIRAGKKKAAGKFSRLKAFARFIAEKMDAKTRWITPNNVRVRAFVTFKCSMKTGRLSRRLRTRI